MTRRRLRLPPEKGKQFPDRREDSPRSGRSLVLESAPARKLSRRGGRVLRSPALCCPGCAAELVPAGRAWSCPSCGADVRAPIRPEWERAVAGVRGLFR